MTLFPVLVDVYHKKQLVTKEEAEQAPFNVWKWGEVAETKDYVTATRIADILYKHGFKDVPQYVRGKYYSELF